MKPLTILIAGPYRSGTGGDARLLERNLHALERLRSPSTGSAICR